MMDIVRLLPLLRLLVSHRTRGNTFASPHMAPLFLHRGQVYASEGFDCADTALRLAPLVCVIGVLPHWQRYSRSRLRSIVPIQFS